MSSQVKQYRIFLSSPGDVVEERKLARSLIKEELPYLAAFRGRVALEVVAWDDPSAKVPMLANETPQESVNQMRDRPATCNIVVVILWSRLGTPLPDTIRKPDGEPYLSGTEWEYLDAYNSSLQPKLLIYKRTEEPKIGLADPEIEQKKEQYQKVNAFFSQFRAEDGSLTGGVNEYESPDDFIGLLGQHLQELIWGFLKEETDILLSPLSSFSESWARSRQVQQEYLECLWHDCQVLPLATLGGKTGHGKTVTLEDVYVSLETTTPEKRDDQKREQNEETRYLTAHEVAVGTDYLVLLGDPGSGKSTFVKQVLAGVIEAQRSGEGDLLPVFITLRDLAPRLGMADLEGLPAEKRRRTLANLVLEYAVDPNVLSVPDAAIQIRQAFTTDGVYLIFDGLDEVPYMLRERVREAVGAVLHNYKINRSIVTCRIRSYTEENRLEGFEVHTLAPFDEVQVQRFIAGWYDAQKQLKALTSADAERLKEDLQKAVHTDYLRPLAENPMLMTTMIMVHQQEKELPRQRVMLYEKAVDILLRKWEQDKGSIPKDLDELLSSKERIRPIIQRLAFEAHSKKASDAAADLPRSEALVILESDGYLGDVGFAGRFLDYIDERSGLLIGRGGAPGKRAAYSFPHRTFQEYLAGCFLINNPRSAVREIRKLAREGDSWSEAMLLGAQELHYNRENMIQLLDNANQLLGVVEEVADEAKAREALWSAQMAQIAGREAVLRDEETGLSYLKRVSRALVKALDSDLPPVERAEAGRLLANLGEDSLELLTLESMSFCYVPAGPFLMGSSDDDEQAYEDEKPQQTLDLTYDYWMGQYPVTQAQFKFFVEAGGYNDDRWWTKEGWQRKESENWQHRAPFGYPFDASNHPVVGVSWYEAHAYVQWLTHLGRKKGWLSEKETMRLSSEPEWEKAARGGLHIPQEISVHPLEGMVLTKASVLVKNERPGRQFPYGDEITVNQSNYNETKIRTTTRPGCFSLGKSPYGVEDMSGNVYEWSRSLWNETPYSKDTSEWDKREVLEGSSNRVIRGGSWYNIARNVRSSYRNNRGPGYRDDILGFRLVRTVL